MANRLKLFVDWTAKQLYKSDVILDVFSLPPFHQYEVVPMEVAVIEPSVTQRGRWDRLDVDDFALTVALNGSLDTATPIAVQDSFSKDSDQNIFYGNLDLNVSNVNSYIGSDSTKSPYFEISMVQSDGSRRKIYLTTALLNKGVVQPVVTSPDPAQVYLTEGVARQLFIPYILPAGKTITLVSPDSTKGRALGAGNDGSFNVDLEILA